MRLTPLHTFRIYLSLKQHFSSSDYNIVKYNWNFIRVPDAQFDKRNDRKFFEILARKKIISEREWVAVLTTGFRKNPSMWTREFLQDYAQLRHDAEVWLDKLSNLPYLFKQEAKLMLAMMDEDGIMFDETFAPWLLKMTVKNKVSVELYIIFNRMFKFQNENDVNYIYLYKEKWLNYDRIFTVDVDRYKGILEKIIIEQREIRI